MLIRLLRISLISLFLLILTSIAWVSAAEAHAQLLSTDPDNGSTLTEAPADVVIRFEESVEVSLGAVKVYDSDSHRVDVGSPKHLNGDAKAVVQKVKGLNTGSYVVTWRVTSSDSHPVQGAITFQVGEQPSGDVTQLSQQLMTGSRTSIATDYLFTAVRAIGFGALGIGIGVWWFCMLAWRAGTAHYLVRRFGYISLIIAIATTAMGVVLQTANASGLPLGDVFNVDAITGVLNTRYGHAAIARIVLLVGLLGIVVSAKRQPFNGVHCLLMGLLGLTTLLTVTLAGHASSGRWIFAATVADLIHLSSITLWLGGLTVVAFVVTSSLVVGPHSTSSHVASQHPPSNEIRTFWTRSCSHELGKFLRFMATTTGLKKEKEPRISRPKIFLSEVTVGKSYANTSDIADALHIANANEIVGKFSRIAGYAIAVIVITGTFQGWRQLGSLHALTSTEYGGLLIIKVAVVLALFTVAAKSRKLVEPPNASTFVDERASSTVSERVTSTSDEGASSHHDMRSLRSSVFIEVVIAVIILSVTSLLVNATPARTEASKPFAQDIHMGPLLTQLVVDPAVTGRNQIHVYVFTAEGQILDPEEINLSLELPKREVASLNVPLETTGPGHAVAQGFPIPFSGDWKMTLKVRTTDIDVYQQTVTVPIR